MVKVPWLLLISYIEITFLILSFFPQYVSKRYKEPKKSYKTKSSISHRNYIFSKASEHLYWTYLLMYTVKTTLKLYCVYCSNSHLLCSYIDFNPSRSQWSFTFGNLLTYKLNMKYLFINIFLAKLHSF